MKIKKVSAEDTEENGMHREINSNNSDSFIRNKWEKDNLKFFGDPGSFLSVPCAKDGSQLGEFKLEMKVP